MVLAALWVLRVLVAYVFDAPFEPTLLAWLTVVTGELIPGIVIWTVGRQYG